MLFQSQSLIVWHGAANKLAAIRLWGNSQSTVNYPVHPQGTADLRAENCHHGAGFACFPADGGPELLVLPVTGLQYPLVWSAPAPRPWPVSFPQDFGFICSTLRGWRYKQDSSALAFVWADFPRTVNTRETARASIKSEWKICTALSLCPLFLPLSFLSSLFSAVCATETP